eukprot:CAMPEP_0176052446 /NCGR_PEP_ID=MMETSP0120_2-20121206/26076_1 /TAXON_ID=160619 /ORGANISM="Kryptoperidinium foliaceum, Strain CCMP 1326" /LENGTH=587 /DNA_ID=CAMNT_0017385885 /DNA_START=24 /DNA_END=1783 /DNA_ORIENTATION=-
MTTVWQQPQTNASSSLQASAAAKWLFQGQQQQQQQHQQAKTRGATQQESSAAGSTSAPASNSTKGVYSRPRISEVIKAVDSLYRDQLKPFGRILLKRIRENAAATASARDGAPVDVESMPLIDPKCLRRICESCSMLKVEPEEGKEYSIVLVGRVGTFIDVTSPEDPYSPQLWEEAAAYFEGLAGDDMLLPGGRYACAQVLVSRQLPFLVDRSLGEVCHIVQLALSQRRILGYRDGNMVPFSQSMDCLKVQCAVWQQPMTSFAKKASPELPLATWEQARCCLWEILSEASSYVQPGMITLSNVKRLFRSRFNLELSETSLGHSRLNELLQDARFSDICTMDMQGKTQVVVQKVKPPGVWDVGTGYWQGADWQYPGEEEALAQTSAGLDPHAVPWCPGDESGSEFMSAYMHQLLEIGAASSHEAYGTQHDSDQLEADAAADYSGSPYYPPAVLATEPTDALIQGRPNKVVMDLLGGPCLDVRDTGLCTSRSTSDGHNSDDCPADDTDADSAASGSAPARKASEIWSTAQEAPADAAADDADEGRASLCEELRSTAGLGMKDHEAGGPGVPHLGLARVGARARPVRSEA